jgi:ankyrin repeat protein
MRRTTDDGALPLHLAVTHASIEVIKFLAERGPRAVEAKTKDGLLPLHVAAQHQTLEVVQYLFSRLPMALQEPSNDGSLPWHVAARSGAPLSVLYFLVREVPGSVGRSFRNLKRKWVDDSSAHTTP